MKKYNIQGDSLVIFRGSMKVPKEEMIDLKDIIREEKLAEILISGDDCIHFIIEFFDDQPANLKIAYHRLHLFAYIAKILIEETFSIQLAKKGTDLYYQDKKINVAIATSSNNSSKIHFGINIVSTGVPNYVKAIGLKEINGKIKLADFALRIAEAFKNELSEIENDIMKSRTF